MKLHIDRVYATAMVEAFPHLTTLKNQLKLGGIAEIAVSQLGEQELSHLGGIYRQAGPHMHGHLTQLRTIQNALSNDGLRYQEDDLEMVMPEIAEFIIAGGQRGWLFKGSKTGKIIPYVITRLDYTPPGEEEAGRILIEIKANTCGKIVVENIVIRSKDIIGKTVSEILINKGYFKETEELLQAYDEISERYYQWRGEYGNQFSAKGLGYLAEDPTSSHRSTDWSRKRVVVLSSSGTQARLVNDENILTERALSFEGSGEILSAYLRKAGRSGRYNDKAESKVEASKQQIPKGMFSELPVHGYIFMFHLELHHHLWVHVDDLQPYQYQPELKDKLILPREHTDLIDILTAEMDVLMDDVVQGKSGGTTVLCAGPAGVGKTLTAEVYSEIIKRPLYRVHSGQLGLNVAEMEKILKETLTRAQRWGAVMLIDEADVYIKRRDDNIAANAVVGVFLRVLEYFNGLLFLTTNRMDDIDEAIVSRCIAIIKYQTPNVDERSLIWRVMTQQFGLEVDGNVLDKLVALFPNATGRDIKGLTKLVAKYCKHKDVLPEIDIFKQCSIFRGMEMSAS